MHKLLSVTVLYCTNYYWWLCYNAQVTFGDCYNAQVTVGDCVITHKLLSLTVITHHTAIANYREILGLDILYVFLCVTTPHTAVLWHFQTLEAKFKQAGDLNWLSRYKQFELNNKWQPLHCSLPQHYIHVRSIREAHDGAMLARNSKPGLHVVNYILKWTR